MRRPNFLLIMTDQHRADHVGCYGNTIVRTPNIDAIASRGTRFDRFYVNCPICMPNRIVMMTGRMPSTNGSRHNGIPLDREAVTFVDLLRADGYRTALIGKCHLQNMTDKKVAVDDAGEAGALKAPPPELSDATRERRVGPEYQAELMSLWAADPERELETPYYGFDHVRLANGHGDQVHGHYDKWLRERDPDGFDKTGWRAALPAPGLTAPQAWRTALPEELYPTSFVEQEVREYLTDYASGDREQPFFLHCSFPDPHHPFTPPGRYFDMYDPDTIPLPESFDRIGENEHPFLKELREAATPQAGNEAGPRPFVMTDEKAARQIIALTYGMISMVDDAIGRILATLKQAGLDEDTIVVFTSDHGDFMGDHGLMLKHGLHYEGVLRVPFIWSDPKAPGRQETDRLAGTIDIGSTILARAGLAPQNGNQGIDVVGETRPELLDARQGMLVEEDELADHLGREGGMRTRTLVTERYRLSMFDGMDYGELFDRIEDPDEMRNLWGSEVHREIRSAMVETMLRETIRLGDTAPRSVHVA